MQLPNEIAFCAVLFMLGGEKKSGERPKRLVRPYPQATVICVIGRLRLQELSFLSGHQLDRGDCVRVPIIAPNEPDSL